MRITNKVLVNDFLGNLHSNLENMQKLQEQLSTGHEVSRPSDDPFKVARTMELTSDISVNERYKSNIDEAIGWLDTTDTALGQIGDVLKRMKELSIQGANGTNNDNDKTAIKDEIEQLKGQLVQIANTVHDGRYIFGGDKTTEPPFKQNADGSVVYQGSTNGLLREFSQGVKLDVATTGDKFMSLFSGNNNVVDSIINKLSTNGTLDGELEQLDNDMDNILNLRSKVGAMQNRMDAMSDKNDSETYNMTALLSKTYDIDVAEKVMQYKVMEAVYTSSLQTGAKILQPSLLDFIR